MFAHSWAQDWGLRAMDYDYTLLLSVFLALFYVDTGTNEVNIMNGSDVFKFLNCLLTILLSNYKKINKTVSY